VEVLAGPISLNPDAPAEANSNVSVLPCPRRPPRPPAAAGEARGACAPTDLLAQGETLMNQAAYNGHRACIDALGETRCNARLRLV